MVLGPIEDAIVRTRKTGKILWCNKVFDSLVGLRHSDVLGRNLISLLPLEENGVRLPREAHPVHVLFETESDVDGHY